MLPILGTVLLFIVLINHAQATRRASPKGKRDPRAEMLWESANRSVASSEGAAAAVDETDHLATTEWQPLSSPELSSRVRSQGLRVWFDDDRIAEIRARYGATQPRVDMLESPTLSYDSGEGFMPPALVVEEDTPAWVRQYEIELV